MLDFYQMFSLNVKAETINYLIYIHSNLEAQVLLILVNQYSLDGARAPRVSYLWVQGQEENWHNQLYYFSKFFILRKHEQCFFQIILVCPKALVRLRITQ